MTAEQEKSYNIMVDKVNNMTLEDWDGLIAKDQCPYEPEHLVGVPMGMFHCPVCGDMLLAGLKHPKRNIVLQSTIVSCSV